MTKIKQATLYIETILYNQNIIIKGQFELSMPLNFIIKLTLFLLVYYIHGVYCIVKIKYRLNWFQPSLIIIVS